MAAAPLSASSGLTGRSRGRAVCRRSLGRSGAWWLWLLRGLAIHVPIAWIRTMGTALGWCVGHVGRWRRKVVEQRLQAAFPDWDDGKRQQVINGMYAWVGTSVLWFLRLGTIGEERKLDELVEIEEDTSEELCELAATLQRDEQGRHGAAIVMSGHIGFWELLPPLLAVWVQPRATQWIVYRPLHDAAVDAEVLAIRQGEARHLVSDKHCFGVLRDALLDTTRANMVGLVADQRDERSGVSCLVSFLGQPTRFATGAARLALQTQRPLWVAVVLHNEPFGNAGQHVGTRHKPFRLVLRRLMSPSSTCNPSVQQLTQAYASALEAIIRENPPQYLWMHNLWADHAQQLVIES